MCGNELTGELVACPQCGEQTGFQRPFDDPVWLQSAIALVYWGVYLAIAALLLAVPIALFPDWFGSLICGGMLVLAGVLVLAGKVRCTYFTTDRVATWLAIHSLIGDLVTIIVGAMQTAMPGELSEFGFAVYVFGVIGASWLVQVALLVRLAMLARSVDLKRRAQISALATFIAIAAFVLAVKVMMF